MNLHLPKSTAVRTLRDVITKPKPFVVPGNILLFSDFPMTHPHIQAIDFDYSCYNYRWAFLIARRARS